MSNIYEIYLVVIVIFIFFAVILTRWILRINHIIERLDRIVNILEKAQVSALEENMSLKEALAEIIFSLNKQQNKKSSPKEEAQ